MMTAGARFDVRYHLLTMKMDDSPRTLGLIAGLGVGAGIFYYRSLVQAHWAHGLSPNLVMVHADVRRVMRLAADRQAPELAAYLAGLLGQLAAAGAEIATIPAFSPQICAKELAEMTPLPLISLLDAIVVEVKRRGLRRIAVFGARVTMETNLFGKLGDIDVITPQVEEVNSVANAYRHIVENEAASGEDVSRLRGLAHTLIAREHLDAILLAGTDFSFVFNRQNTDFPHVDGARTHIDAIMHELVRGKE
jgi:aspartate racemase